MVPHVGFHNAVRIAREQIATVKDAAEVKKLVASLAAEALLSPVWCAPCGAFEPLRDAVREANTKSSLVAALVAMKTAFESDSAVWKAVDRNFVPTFMLAKQVLVGVALRAAHAAGDEVPSMWGAEVNSALNELVSIFDEGHRVAAAGDVDALKRMIYSGRVWINCSNSRGMTMLMCAAARGNVACVRALLRHGAAADAIVNGPSADGELRGMTALAFAFRAKHQAVVDILTEHARSLGPSPKRRAELAAAFDAEAAARSSAAGDAAAAGESEDTPGDASVPGAARRALPTLMCPSSWLALIVASVVCGPAASALLHTYSDVHANVALAPSLAVLLVLLLELGNCANESEAQRKHGAARDVAMKELEVRLERERSWTEQSRQKRMRDQERSEQAQDLARRRRGKS
jgi:hypothetical protein